MLISQNPQSPLYVSNQLDGGTRSYWNFQNQFCFAIQTRHYEVLLQVDPAHFGIINCDSFAWSYNHNAQNEIPHRIWIVRWNWVWNYRSTYSMCSNIGASPLSLIFGLIKSILDIRTHIIIERIIFDDIMRENCHCFMLENFSLFLYNSRITICIL